MDFPDIVEVHTESLESQISEEELKNLRLKQATTYYLNNLIHQPLGTTYDDALTVAHCIFGVDLDELEQELTKDPVRYRNAYLEFFNKNMTPTRLLESQESWFGTSSNSAFSYLKINIASRLYMYNSSLDPETQKEFLLTEEEVISQLDPKTIVICIAQMKKDGKAGDIIDGSRLDTSKI